MTHTTKYLQKRNLHIHMLTLKMEDRHRVRSMFHDFSLYIRSLWVFVCFLYIYIYICLQYSSLSAPKQEEIILENISKLAGLL